MNKKQYEAIYDNLLDEYTSCGLSDYQTFMLELVLSPADRKYRIDALLRAGALLREAASILADDRCGITLNGLCSQLEEGKAFDEIMRLSLTLELMSEGHPCSALSPSGDHAGSA
jgi:hypothetical protein